MLRATAACTFPTSWLNHVNIFFWYFFWTQPTRALFPHVISNIFWSVSPVRWILPAAYLFRVFPKKPADFFVWMSRVFRWRRRSQAQDRIFQTSQAVYLDVFGFHQCLKMVCISPNLRQSLGKWWLTTGFRGTRVSFFLLYPHRHVKRKLTATFNHPAISSQNLRMMRQNTNPPMHILAAQPPSRPAAQPAPGRSFCFKCQVSGFEHVITVKEQDADAPGRA